MIQTCVKASQLKLAKLETLIKTKLKSFKKTQVQNKNKTPLLFIQFLQYNLLSIRLVDKKNCNLYWCNKTQLLFEVELCLAIKLGLGGHSCGSLNRTKHTAEHAEYSTIPPFHTAHTAHTECTECNHTAKKFLEHFLLL